MSSTRTSCGGSLRYPATHHARCALLVVAIALVMFGLARLLHSTRSPLPAADEATLQSLAPVLAGATDTQACLVLTADKAVLRDEAKQGFVMMQRYGGSLIAMGDPVGPPEVARD